MTHALAFRMSRAAPAVAQAARALPNAAFVLVIAAVLACDAGIANMPSARARAADAPVVHQDAPVQAVAAAADASAGAVGDEAAVWGVVESITALQPVADRADEFEFIVRLRDRSARVTHTVGRAQWRVGDRIMLMGGNSPPVDSQPQGRNPCSIPSPSSC
jgi:hypothetical protein